jgi:hypothetical protein
MSRKRGRLLLDGVLRMLGEEAGGEFFRDPVITSMGAELPKHSRWRADARWAELGLATAPPSGIPERYFAEVVLRLLAQDEAGELRRRVDSLRLECCSRSGERSVETAEEVRALDLRTLELWFGSVMERLTGQYRRWAGWCAVWASLIICAGLNLDTIAVVRGLAQVESRSSAQMVRSVLEQDTAFSDSLNRRAVSTQADTSRAHQALRIPLGRDTAVSRDDSLTLQADARLQRRDSLVSWRRKSTQETQSSRVNRFELIAGWHGVRFGSLWDVIVRAIGILISAAAGTMGSSFWFNAMKPWLKGAGPITPVKPELPAVASAPGIRSRGFRKR